MRARNITKPNQPATVIATGGILEILESRHKAMKVGEVADLLRVTPQHIYKMAARGRIPAFRLDGAIRIDPKQLRDWLMRKMPQATIPVAEARIAV